MRNKICSQERHWKLCDKCGLSKYRRTVVLRGNGHVDGRGTVERDGFNIYWRGIPTETREANLLQSVHRRNNNTSQHLTNTSSSFPSFQTTVPFILFLGEAPGEQEDVTGLPFQGESGRIFNYCLSLCKTSFTFEVTNLVACRPATYSSFGTLVNRTPTSKEISSCKPRLDQIIRNITYDGIVYLGSLASNYPTTLPTVTLLHPAFILRKEYKMYDMKHFAKALDNYVSSYFETKG